MYEREGDGGERETDRGIDRAGWPLLAMLGGPTLGKVRVALCLHLRGALYRQGLQRLTFSKVSAG